MPREEILHYWRILKKRLWLIALLTLVTVGTIFFQQYTADPVYTAAVRFQITEPPRGDANLFSGYRVPYIRDELPFVKGNFLNVLTSGSVARQVIEKLDLQSVSSDDVISNIETEEITDSDFVLVRVSASDPQLAADLANALLEEALRQYGQLRADSVTMSKELISVELEASWQKLQQSEESFIAFKIENHVGSLTGMITEQQELLRTLRLWRDESSAKGLDDRAQNYDHLIARREAELQNLVRLSAEYGALEADVQHAQRAYNLLLEKETEVRLTESEALGVGFIQVLGEARLPSGPNSPYNYKVLAFGLVVSLALGVALAFIWAFLASAKTAEEELEEPESVVQGIAKV
jgi:uncharacterized protein involved in exopolysaccharide biosynthesis